MPRARQTKRPKIILRKSDAERLTTLALSAEDRVPDVARLLLEELERAEVRDDAKAPAGVVCMNSTVRFVDEAHGEVRTVQLVYPHEADISTNRISVLTPVGAGLIGLSPGQSILWPDRQGRRRELRILEVRPAELGSTV